MRSRMKKRMKTDNRLQTNLQRHAILICPNERTKPKKHKKSFNEKPSEETNEDSRLQNQILGLKVSFKWVLRFCFLNQESKWKSWSVQVK